MNELLKSGYVCHPQQLYTLRRVTVTEGKAGGTQIIEVSTAGGLQVDLLPDAGLDIGQVRYKGVNVSFISKNGYDSPAAIMPYEKEFLNTFPGGLLYTSGLRTTGHAHRDGEEWQPFHGRYHSLRAEQVSASVEGDAVIVKGIMRETALFGHCLELVRTIRIPVLGAAIEVSDRLTNMTHSDQEYAILYHCNYGYPLISDKAHVELPEDRTTTARAEYAQEFIGRETTFDAPVPDEPERVFYHENMEHWAALVNESLGIRTKLTWADTLPVLAHWRSMASGDYACGMEPTNTYLKGRKMERENGTLPVLKPFESMEFGVTFTFETI